MRSARATTDVAPLGLLLPPMDPVPRRGDKLPTVGSTQRAPFGSTESITEICRAAEAAGAGGIWATDHLFWRRPSLECMTTLAVAATVTRHALLGTCVLQLPLRSAAAVAKQVTALQLLSGGRFVLGVGAGSHVREFDLAGADFASRGQRLDEGVASLRRAWAGEDADYRQEPAVPSPVWVGGASEPALRRAAAFGDGWVPLFCDPDTFATRLRRVRDMCEAAGRDPGTLDAAAVMVAHVDDDAARGRARGTAWLSSLYGIPPKAFERHVATGPAARVADTAARYLDAGAGHVVVFVAADDAVGQFAQVTQAAAGAWGTTDAALPSMALAGGAR